MKISSPKKMLWLVSFVLLYEPILSCSLQGPVGCTETTESGEPLFVTRLLETSSVLEVQRAATVWFLHSPEFKQVRHIRSCSGFFTVNKTLNSNIFFWFFPAETNPESSPLVLWLEGGPGLVSILDVFISPSGPLQIRNSHLTPGKNRWTKIMNVLYLDSPVGAGFSFTQNTSGYAIDQKDYTRDLFAAVTQFFQLFPGHIANDFFIAGISYAGKYIPNLAYEIHLRNQNSTVKINLKGITIGNGLVDPLIQVEYSKFLFGIGAIDSKTMIRLRRIENEVKKLILHKEYAAAAKILTSEYVSSVDGIVVNETGVSMQNYLTSDAEYEKRMDTEFERIAEIVSNTKFRKSIHVGNQEFWLMNPKYGDYLLADVAQSVTPKLEVLMNNYRVVLYAGQLDILCNYRLMIDFVEKLQWKGAEEYRNASRLHWWVDGELAGYSKSGGSFTEILVRNAGPFAHAEQPLWVFDLLNRMTHNLLF